MHRARVDGGLRHSRRCCSTRWRDVFRRSRLEFRQAGLAAKEVWLPVVFTAKA
ncbi:hypothetical protein MYA_3641 [Burkholderia sp. KJ006]|nr:hypothetical protein MYA_3641 [Burkholderia sp. KJ006]